MNNAQRKGGLVNRTPTCHILLDDEFGVTRGRCTGQSPVQRKCTIGRTFLCYPTRRLLGQSWIPAILNSSIGPFLGSTINQQQRHDGLLHGRRLVVDSIYASTKGNPVAVVSSILDWRQINDSMEDEEEQFVNAICQFLDAMGSPRVIHGGRGGLNSRTNLAYAFYLLTASFYYPRFRSLPTDGGHKRELASYVARILQFRLGYTFELKNGEHVEWDHPFVIDKVGKRIQGQDAIAFSYDRLYSVGVPDRLADGVRRVIQQFELPVNLEVSGGLFATIVSQSGVGQGDVIARWPLDDPLPQAVNHDSEGNDDSEEEENGEVEDDDNWFDMLR